MSAIAVRCSGLTKYFGAGDVKAIEGLDLEVSQGEILALLGASGCGKTTTLRLIAGFETPTAGEIEVGGQIVAAPGLSLPPEQRRVGMVFQNYALFPHLSVARNIAYGLSRTGRARRVTEVLALVGLADYSERMPHQLSGGQQQRVAIARALAPQPAVLLLDEPFSNLDTGRRAQMREEVRDILKRSATTAIFVTHSQQEALFMGDRVALINGGRLAQVGTPEQVFHDPATRFVAEFMGETDFLAGEVTAEGILTELGLLPQPAAQPPGTPVEVAFRADDVALAADPHGSARIVTRLFRGAVNVYRVRLASGQLVHSLQPHTATWPPGTAVRAWAEPGHPLSCFPRNGANPTK